MKFRELHSWNVSPAEAADLQSHLAGLVDVRTPLARWELVAGADIAYERLSNTIHAGVVVLRASDGAIVEKQAVVHEATFPYIPGFFSFREAPALLQAFAKLQATPDVVMLDGQGLAHPRRLGLACHVGLWLEVPCLGCAKSRLVGDFTAPGVKAGSVSPLTLPVATGAPAGGEVIGQVVRTKDRVKPVFVSPGHRIDLNSAVRVVLETCRGYRLPEPARQAHLYVNALRRGEAC
jgi:deoxyribonuclease V